MRLQRTQVQDSRAELRIRRDFRAQPLDRRLELLERVEAQPEVQVGLQPGLAVFDERGNRGMLMVGSEPESLGYRGLKRGLPRLEREQVDDVAGLVRRRGVHRRDIDRVRGARVREFTDPCSQQLEEADRELAIAGPELKGQMSQPRRGGCQTF
jgi:hypothetical protein